MDHTSSVYITECDSIRILHDISFIYIQTGNLSKFSLSLYEDIIIEFI